MQDETKLIGEVKRDGSLLYELTVVDAPHGLQAKANRWEANVTSCMGLVTPAEREQIAERLRVAVTAYEPMREALSALLLLAEKGSTRETAKALGLLDDFAAHGSLWMARLLRERARDVLVKASPGASTARAAGADGREG